MTAAGGKRHPRHPRPRPVISQATPVTDALVAVFREQWGQIVATLSRVTGDRDLAEECAQDAFASALERWPADGVPRRPGAWLTTAARNRAIDRGRREARGREKLLEAGRLWHLDECARSHEDWEPGAVADDRLRLIFACCHPALPPETSVALALRTVAGLSTDAVARAFGVSELAMSKRLVRAKSRIRGANIPLRVPPAHLLGERVETVLIVLRLMWDDARGEAIRLARALTELMPEHAGARDLLGVMLLYDGELPDRFPHRPRAGRSQSSTPPREADLQSAC